MPGMAISQLFSRRWVIILLVVLLLFGLLLVVLPIGISLGMNQWLSDNGGEDVTIDNVDFNAFTGKASLQGLQLSDGQQPLLKIPRLDIDVDWLPLLSRQLVLRSVVVNGVSIDIREGEDGRLRIGGIDLPEGEAGSEVDPDKSWQVGVDRIDIVDTEIHYQASGLDIETRLDDMTMSGIKTWVDEPARLRVRGSLNGAPLSLEGELPPLSAGAGYRGQLTVDGLNLDAFAALADEFISGLAGQLSADTTLDLLIPAGGAIVASQAGKLELASLQFAQAANQLSLGALSWQGEASYKGGEDAVMQAGGGITAATLAFDMQDSAAQLARVGSLEGQLQFDAGGDVVISDLAAGDIALGNDREDAGDRVLAVTGLKLDKAQLVSGDIALGKLDLQGLVADLRRNKAGQWRVSQLLESLPKADAETAESAVEPEASGTAAFRIAGVTVGGDSAIALRDDTVSGGFKTRAVITAADIGPIDIAQPEQDTPVRLNASTGKHSKIEVNGTVRPLAEQVTLSLDSKLKGIALTQVSPYTTDALGYALQSGRLDADTSARINAGKMEISNKLVMRGLDVKPVDNASREKLDSQTSVPLNTALDMLRDKHDTIKLELPVNGDIDNPEFDISDAINQAVGKALKKGSMTYLKLALQPYGALLTVAQLAGEAASKVRLDPVSFTPGETALPTEAHSYMEKVAGILDNRPELNIKVCGVASQLDNLSAGGPPPPTAGGRLPDTVLDEPSQAAATPADAVPAAAMSEAELLELATARAEAVIDYLVTTHAISASRLVACQPEIDNDVEGKGRVDLLI